MPCRELVKECPSALYALAPTTMVYACRLRRHSWCPLHGANRVQAGVHSSARIVIAAQWCPSLCMRGLPAMRSR